MYRPSIRRRRACRTRGRQTPSRRGAGRRSREAVSGDASGSMDEPDTREMREDGAAFARPRVFRQPDVRGESRAAALERQRSVGRSEEARAAEDRQNHAHAATIIGPGRCQPRLVPRSSHFSSARRRSQRHAVDAAPHGTRRPTPTSPDRQRRIFSSSRSTRCGPMPSARTVRVGANPHARRACGRWSAVRQRVRPDTHHPSFARELVDRVVPARSRRPSQRDCGARRCADAGARLRKGRIRDGGVRLGVSARSPIWPGERVRSVRGPVSTRPRHASAQRAARLVDGG